MSFRLTLLLVLIAVVSYSANNGYVGSDVCAGCHKDIAKTQAQTNMARTWQGVGTQQLAPNYLETFSEGPDPAIDYKVQRTGDQATYRIQMPGQPAVEYPVEATIGGRRHAISFLFRVPSMDGSPLPRQPLVEGRYIHSVLEHGLALELGFPEDKPSNYEVAFGRVLTPSLEKRCLSCHVAPRTWGTRVEKGVACENCHGPGQSHLAALAAHNTKDLGIINPGKWPVAERMRPCTQCHAGSGFVEDPMADNLLISDQVTALKNSECWRQTAGQITCTNCHNPHEDAPRAVVEARSEKTCLGCHSAAVTKRAALCPVNRTGGCVGCHMPASIHGAFHLANHWINVHPEQHVEVTGHNPAWRSTLTPLHVYLRIIALDDPGKAADMRQQIVSGASFFELARANSLDHDSAKNGGFLGDKQASELDPAWAAMALKLQPGETSDVVQAAGKYLIIQRMPRNFREEAENKVNDAVKLRKEGRQRDAVNELVDALKIYPQFLRALTYLGIIYSQTDNPRIGAGVLEMATHLYPRDQGAHFNLGVAYGAMGSGDQIAEFKRTLEIDPDYVPAYLNWGGALYAQHQYEDAVELYRKALLINPLNAALHYSLSLALEKLDKKQEAASELELATKIDPGYAHQ